jgi:hypothetical protein
MRCPGPTCGWCWRVLPWWDRSARQDAWPRGRELARRPERFILDSLVTTLAARGKRVTVEQNDLHPPAWRIVVDDKVQGLISHPTQAEAIVAALEAAAGLPKAETR